MRPLIGFVVGGAIGCVGGLVWASWKESGPYDFSVLFYMPAGCLVGALIGTGIGSAL